MYFNGFGFGIEGVVLLFLVCGLGFRFRGILYFRFSGFGFRVQGLVGLGFFVFRLRHYGGLGFLVLESGWIYSVGVSLQREGSSIAALFGYLLLRKL